MSDAAIVFGDDDGADDAYADEGEPEPEQVALRLHELRQYVEALVGNDDLNPFDALTPTEQQLAVAIGAVIVEWILSHDPDHPGELAEALHNVRRYWSGNAMRSRAELNDDERDIAVTLMRLVIEWLQREGTA